MLEMIDQPDVWYRVSSGFGFDNGDCSQEKAREGDSHRLEGPQEAGADGHHATRLGGSQGSRTIQAEEQ